MANTKQAQKMVRKNQNRTQYNRWWKTKIKDTIKALDAIVAEPNFDKTKAEETLKSIQKNVDKAQKNGVIKPNKASRLKSQAAFKINVEQPK